MSEKKHKTCAICGLAVIEEHAEILRRYYKGELVDKTEFLAQIRERLGEL